MTPEAMRKVAMERLRERARRIGVIRRSVIAGAVATFALAWGLALSDQLAHGTKTSPDDTSASADTTTPAETTAVQVTGDDSELDDDGELNDDGELDSGEGIAVSPAPTTVAPTPAPLTTSQS